MKVCLIIIYIQVHIYQSEEINKYSMFKCRLFLVHKLMSTCMIGLYVHKSFLLYNGCLETVYINIQKYFTLLIYGTNNSLTISGIQSLSIKLMVILMQGSFLIL